MFTKWDNTLVKTAPDPVRRRPATPNHSKRFTFFLLLALFCLWQSCSALLAGEQTPFEVFKTLQGQWSIRSGDKTLPFHMTYELGSNAQ